MRNRFWHQSNPKCKGCRTFAPGESLCQFRDDATQAHLELYGLQLTRHRKHEWRHWRGQAVPVASRITVFGGLQVLKNLKYWESSPSFSGTCKKILSTFFIFSIPFRTARSANDEERIVSSLPSSERPRAVMFSFPSATLTGNYKGLLSKDCALKRALVFPFEYVVVAA